MNYLFFGGCNEIAIEIACGRLEGKKNKVTIFDNLSKKGAFKLVFDLMLAKKGVRFIQKDIRDFYEVRRAVEGIDIVYNFARYPKNGGWRNGFETEYCGTFNVLEAVSKSKKKTKTFIRCPNSLESFVTRYAKENNLDVDFV